MNSLTNIELEELVRKQEQLQATINLGCVGHVSHGKSTLVRAISGIKTQKHTEEQIRNITIKLGYANAKIYYCGKCEKYRSYGLQKCKNKEIRCDKCDGYLEFKRHISFVDCPGHEVYMSTMLKGVSAMDAPLLLVAYNGNGILKIDEQTKEHMKAINIFNKENLLVLQNKVDLASDKESVKQHHELLKLFLTECNMETTPIIPISAQLNLNIDLVLKYLVEYVKPPQRDLRSPCRLLIIRSFDINKPGTLIDNIKGGVAGCTVQKGIVKIGDKLEIRPGIIRKIQPNQLSSNDKLIWKKRFEITPLTTTVTSLFAENIPLQIAIPGGLIGVGTDLDPFLTISDKLTGQIMGLPSSLPPVFASLDITCDISDIDPSCSLSKNDKLLINAGSISVRCLVFYIKKRKSSINIRVDLEYPICIDIGDKIALSYLYSEKWRLIGSGIINDGDSMLD